MESCSKNIRIRNVSLILENFDFLFQWWNEIELYMDSESIKSFKTKTDKKIRKKNNFQLNK